MDSNQQARALFDRAIDLPPEEREGFVRANCSEAETVENVLAWLAHHAAAAGFLETSPVPPMPAIPSRIAEFEIVRVLGHGGMGVVYEAKDTVLNRRVAIKVLAPHLLGSEQAVARLRQEARAIAGVHHPGIVVVHRYGEEDGLHHIVMEFVEGGTLATRLARERAAVPPDAGLPATARTAFAEIARIISGVADALEHAHRHGIIHRDIKPSNIMLGADGEPRLTDFGIARVAAEPAMTATGSMAGTVPYLSPEQAAAISHRIDHRTDIYSLGVVLYECLALRVPFDGESIQQILDSIRANDPPRLRSLNPMIPRDLETICHKAMEKNPANRYQTASQMSADLRCWLRGDPILAAPPSVVRRARRWCYKRKRQIAAATICTLIVLASGLGLLLEANRRAGLCPVTITSTPAGAAVRIRRVDEQAGAPQDARPLGRTPATTSLLPGQYRVVIVADDGSFAEGTLLLLIPGRSSSFDFSIVHDADATAGMIRIDAGAHTLGLGGREGVQAERVVNLPLFFLDATEVSNEQFQRFVAATGHQSAFTYDPALAARPVVAISWEDAQAFARWAGKRLPTADEWEAAMRAPDGRVVPWITEPDGLPLATLSDRDRFDAAAPEQTFDEYRAHTVDVRSHPELATPLGLYHGATNVQEYTDTIRPGPTAQVVVKGASWLNVPAYSNFGVMRTKPLVSVDRKQGEPVWARSMTVGFRCARSASPD